MQCDVLRMVLRMLIILVPSATRLKMSKQGVFHFLSICHNFLSREPREAPWPLHRPPKVYGTGDKNNKDEKSVNGTQISIVKFPPGKRHYLLRIPFIPENFQWKEPKSRVSLTS